MSATTESVKKLAAVIAEAFHMASGHGATLGNGNTVQELADNIAAAITDVINDIQKHD